MPETGGFVVTTIHDGTDVGILDYDPERDEPDERHPTLAEATEAAKALAAEMGCRWYDLSEGA